MLAGQGPRNQSVECEETMRHFTRLCRCDLFSRDLPRMRDEINAKTTLSRQGPHLLDQPVRLVLQKQIGVSAGT